MKSILPDDIQYTQDLPDASPVQKLLKKNRQMTATIEEYEKVIKQLKKENGLLKSKLNSSE